jgi:DNA-binding CsgD family transcriptional regulator
MLMKLADAWCFIEQLKDCSSCPEVGSAFARTTAPFGFPIVSCGGFRETPSGRTWQFFFNSWPSEWLHQDKNHDYVRHDVAPMRARFRATPFTWVEFFRDGPQTVQQIEFHNRVRELGVVDGYAVPVHQPGGDLGLCVSASTHLIEDSEERVALHVASLYAFHRCQALGGSTNAGSVKVALSPREVECLRWVLDGKSDTDISKIIGISHTTVHFHVERVKKKLGVRTRAQAAAVVMTLGYF